MTTAIVCQPIGVIHSRSNQIEGIPIQNSAAPDEPGEIEIFERYTAGLADIEGFEFLMLLTHFHQVTQERLEVVPFLDTRSHGVFATCAPARANRIGVSMVRLIERQGARLVSPAATCLTRHLSSISNHYVPAFDSRPTDRIGWFEERIAALSNATSDDRMR